MCSAWGAVQQSALPQRGTCWRTSRGCVAIWTPFPTLLVVALQNQGEGAFAAPILSAYRAMKREAGRLHLFFDAEHLTNYDSALRTSLTAGFFSGRDRLQEFQVLLGSKIVAMGVSVANLALGGIVSVTNDRQSFRSALDGTLYSLGVQGFSSNILDASLQPLANLRQG